MNKYQDEAISQMAENRHQYNRGVLAMLGKEALAGEHEMVCRTIEILIQQRDELSPMKSFDDLLAALPAEAQKIQEQIEWNVARRNEAWAPIQAMIDEARAALEAADPLGLGQAI